MILIVLLFFVIILRLGRWLGQPVFHAVAILIAGSIAEGIGLHAFLGAFLLGVALGERDHERNQAHETISIFVLSFFVPIYFVAMGMSTNFATNFDGLLVGVILIAACVAKIGAALPGARLAGMPVNRQAWAIGFGLNARGATGIILASIGLNEGIIDERIYVAIVVMALITSLMSAPAMSFLLIKPPSFKIPK
jgi:Kef-type K+ transport system membrane component KefB